VSPSTVVLGLRANWRQFSLLVVVNAFVGAMVGLERTVTPLVAEQGFGVASKAAALSFLVSFGLVKALANLAAGRLADRVGRKPVLVAGWLAGLPVPFLLILAPNWSWVVFANILLGVNQGLSWSTTVIMKIDLVGPRRRGLAMGLNECAGYLAVSLVALLTGYLAATYGLRPFPFYPGVAFALAGLLLSAFFVRETRFHAQLEARANPGRPAASEPAGPRPSFAQVLLATSWNERTLFAASQAGLVNNLNDGMIWGLLPLHLAGAGLSLENIGLIAAAYPAVWGSAQLATGALSDLVGRKRMVVAGMWLQALAIALFVVGRGFGLWLGGAVLLGLGTAMVYPTLLAVISDVANPAWRASAVGVYRLWRDAGYAVGALTSGLLADAFSVPVAFGAVAGLTWLSGLVAARVMKETLPSGSPSTILPPHWVAGPK